MKTCKTCGASKDASDFYVVKGNLDGRSGSCKACACARIRRERRANPDKHSERERARHVGARREQINEAARSRRATPGAKRDAQTAIGNAVRDGRIQKPSACSRCSRDGVRIEGHHDDYAKPLDVVWLCVRCHRRHHADNPHLPA